MNDYEWTQDDVDALIKRQYLNVAEIPDIHRDATLDQIKPINAAMKETLQVARDYVGSFEKLGRRNGLLLFGKTGTGKTHIAVAVLKELISRDRKGLFITCNDYLRRIRASYNSRGETEQEIFDEVASVPLLVLDDLGESSKSEWGLGQLYDLVNARYNAGLPMIITSNLVFPGEYEPVVGERGVSRLHQVCIIRSTGRDTPDFRRRSDAA